MSTQNISPLCRSQKGLDINFTAAQRWDNPVEVIGTVVESNTSAVLLQSKKQNKSDCAFVWLRCRRGRRLRREQVVEQSNKRTKSAGSGDRSWDQEAKVWIRRLTSRSGDQSLDQETEVQIWITKSGSGNQSMDQETKVWIRRPESVSGDRSLNQETKV